MISIWVRTMKVFTIVLFASIPSSVDAHQFRKGQIEVQHPWAMTIQPNSTVLGGYLTIENFGIESDRLVRGSTNIAERLEIQESLTASGSQTTRTLKDGIKISPGAIVRFEPGGPQLVLVNLRGSLSERTLFKGTLLFEKAGPLDVEFVYLKTAPAPDALDHWTHASP
ncbi:copper chaperone PCu(A)C [Agrobacterium tumefaciens]|uniref:copper chaperone PCu(A)C n=1 Tax=Agrobacterium tumefaciens TaxID=358 RepID=UPI001574889B|nr:copper chaperone PCu(A)C [Agrobacterium tumefaciens]NTD11704.1 copper chaperone PCu(A)C [Agrobacterium tumefaciens]